MIYEGKAITVKALESGIVELNFDLKGESVNKFNRLTLNDLRQAVEILESVSPISSRVMGPRHPHTLRNEEFLGVAREKLAQAEAPVARRTRSSKAEES